MLVSEPPRDSSRPSSSSLLKPSADSLWSSARILSLDGSVTSPEPRRIRCLVSGTRRKSKGGSASATSTSTIGRSSAASRTAPPTIQASSPANNSSTSSRIDDHPPGAGGIAVDPTNELVVDRAGHPGMIFRHHSVPEQRHRRPGRQLAIELDGKSVHRDRADDPPRLALDPDFGSGQVTAKAVRVTDRNDPDPGRPLGHEASPVAGALAGCELSNLREPARPAERGLETIVPGGGAEGRETVDR